VLERPDAIHVGPLTKAGEVGMNTDRRSSAYARWTARCAVAALAAASLAQFGKGAVAAPPAAFTGTNAAVDGPGTCLNGPGDVNCNLYTSKNFVWLNAGPAGTSTGGGDGTYFFAVSVPGAGGQNDGDANNLSDPPTGDSFTNRSFTVSSGVAAYAGTHDATGNNTSALKIRLMPYDDTTNAGGEYQISICRLAPPDFSQPVRNNDCKNDNFKIANVQADLTVAKTAIPAFTRTHAWTLSKSVEDATLQTPEGTAAVAKYTVTADKTSTDSAWSVSGTITVTNPNSTPASASVSDQIRDADLVTADPNATCTIAASNPVVIPANSSVNLNYDCVYSAAPAASSQVNHAMVTWSGFGTGSAFIDAPISWATPTTVVGSNCVVATDDFNSSGAVALDPSNICQDTTFSYVREIAGVSGTCREYPNTAALSTEPPTTASATVQVCVAKDLTVTKTAKVTYKRLYEWAVNKTVDKVLVKRVGGTATFDYAVTVTQTGVTDSEFSASGTITVANPNDWQDITLTGLTDAVDNGGSCVVNPSASVVVPRSGSLIATYTCTYAAKPADGTNTATATWDKVVASTPKGTASGTALVTVGAPSTEVNKTVTVTDSFNGGAATGLGSATASDSMPYTVKVFAYPRSIPVVAGCRDYPNTATITETGATASQSVRVCGPLLTGAKTIGFWQNKNGQAILTGGSSTAGICNSGTWLRQYAPFQDLSANATCAQVATYVTNVIKSASASGAAMNAMLKAQMLATSLDVYFSNAALGGNKIGAAQPLGGVAVDLTMICKDLAACSVLNNTSPAFGGSTSATVSQLLVYAASQSNAGGSLWYGQVKSMQELAKDTFDAINNEKVFSP
jgi:hypothetical protein